MPIGMCQVSSVILTAEVGVTLRKGEELSYFQFGGSDIIMLFEAAANVSFTAQPAIHYKMVLNCTGIPGNLNEICNFYTELCNN